MTVQVGDDELEAPPGTYACVPPGVLHAFANRSEQPVRFLNLNTPGGWEDYIRDLAAVMPADGPPDPRVLGEVLARYDVVFPSSSGALPEPPAARLVPEDHDVPPGLEHGLEVAPLDRLLRPPAVDHAPFLPQCGHAHPVHRRRHPVLADDERRARLVQSSRGTRIARVSGMRDHGATSTTVQTASALPTAARTC